MAEKSFAEKWENVVRDTPKRGNKVKPKITFEYYDGSRKKRPPMSDLLWEMIQAAVRDTGAVKCHIVDVGTVGDPETHRPGTSHMQEPPMAIDLRKVFLHFPTGKVLDLILIDSKANRKLVATVWRSLGGVVAHQNDLSKEHIHLAVPKEMWNC